MNLEDLMRINDGYKAARILHTAVILKIFDQLASEARSAKGVAESLKLDCRATGILLDALAALKIIEKTNDRYVNTEIAQRYLVSSSPAFYGALILHTADGWESWGKLEKVIRTGKPVPHHRAHQDDPEDTERFIMAMHGLAAAGNYPAMVADALDLSNVKSSLDVGGGPGSFTYELCRRVPGLKAAILDLPGTLEVTKKVLKNYPEYKDRVKLIAADFNEDPVPGSYDLILVSNIIHSESFEENASLMKKLFAATNKGGKIVVKDHIMSEDGLTPAYGTLFSVHMLVHTKGRDYKFSEVKSWLEEAGYTSIEKIPLSEITSASMVIGNRN
jgi:ubiquinone/menaquinone biosynthesis C-methylase UbiE